MDELTRAAELPRGEAALATIVHTRGHCPREVGARMVVLRDGRTFGTIGGGCGESEVRLRALEVIAQKHPVLHVVDLLDDPALEDGAVCGGKMEVFIELL
ncbi:MAG TPA: XdhC family protein [Symbiobacteriaceae bacterium]|nr:XdhC family protein [Symbiobacteriaceae bacterium]